MGQHRKMGSLPRQAMLRAADAATAAHAVRTEPGIWADAVSLESITGPPG